MARKRSKVTILTTNTDLMTDGMPSHLALSIDANRYTIDYGEYAKCHHCQAELPISEMFNLNINGKWKDTWWVCVPCEQEREL
jgi:hypothetical protein